MRRIITNGNREIRAGFAPQVNSEPIVVIKSYVTIGIDELITLGKITEEFKKKWKKKILR